jgi:transcriptional regulator with GAF, ATPase, and Fis domain
MNPTHPISHAEPVACDLESVIATRELKHRSSRPPNRDIENQTDLELARALAKSPDGFYQKLVDTVLTLSLADSAGISLLDEKNGRFVWPAVAGGLTPYLWGGTPSGFGPCGTVLERDQPVLFVHPERHFTYLAPIQPPLEEVLLIPFHIDHKAVGTLWAVIHTPGKKFQSEDQRLLTNLTTFASAAYKVLAAVGAIEPLLNKKA